MDTLGRYMGNSAFARKGQALDLFAVLITVALLVMVAAGWLGLPRILIALAFTFFVPGRAIVTNWPRAAHWSAAAIPMVLSLAVLGLVATAALWAHAWHPVRLFAVEAVLSLAGLGAGMARRLRAAPPEDAAAPAGRGTRDGGSWDGGGRR